MFLIIGCMSFVVMCLGDIFYLKTNNRYVRLFFPLGLLCCLASTFYFCIKSNFLLYRSLPIIIVFIVFSIIFLFLLIYSLFFALPSTDTYSVNGTIKKTCDNGVYALCRHPGIIWFSLFYLSLWGAGLVPWYISLIFSVENLIYAIVQDIYIFSKTIPRYNEYKKNTPFLIPNINSIKKCINTITK